MHKIYLKIVDIDQFEESLLTDENEATHSVEVDEDDYIDVIEVLTKYLPKIKPHLPLDPNLTDGLENWA